MLTPYTVLDFTDHRGEIGPMVLADLGAEVIRVETSGGSQARQSAPFAQGQSLVFEAFNRNKRSIVLDPGCSDDVAALEQLIARAHFVFESSPNGGLDEFGLGFDQLKGLNEQIVFVEISPYGTTGPRADDAFADLVLAALGGPVALQGVPERAPVRLSVPQVWRHAGAESAAAALVAHTLRMRTGAAQHVDLAAQCVMTWTLLNAMDAYAIQGHEFQRLGECINTGDMTRRIVYQAADGHIVAIPTSRLILGCLPWMQADGVADESLNQIDWEEYDLNMRNPDYDGFTAQQGEELVQRFLRLHTKQELFQYGLEHDVSLAPVNNLSEMLALEHMQQRSFWNTREVAGREVRVAGNWAKANHFNMNTQNPAPKLGQHETQVRAKIGAEPEALQVGSERDVLPFSGIKVADFSWVGVGPISAKYLADHGAEVVRIESEGRPDVLRAGGPFKEHQGLNRSQFYGDFNTSKQSLALDLKNPKGIELAKKLILDSDILIESFAPGAIGRMGLSYEVLKQEHPSLIMISTCLMGQTGDAAQLAGYGYHAGAIAGFYEVTGWPDLGPNGPWIAYTDTIAPRFVSCLLAAALDHRRRTGEGCFIDVAQIETALQFLAPEILDLQLNGYQATRLGNRDRFTAPQGCYPCADEDRWCAIAIEQDEQWQALCRIMGFDDWAADERLATAEGRLSAQDEIDARIAAWTRVLSPSEVMFRLQGLGIPAGVVQTSQELLNDPQYAHRQFYRYHDHPEMGHIPYAGHQYKISGYDNGPRGPAPCLGEHSFTILTERLGLSDEEVAEAYASGVVN